MKRLTKLPSDQPLNILIAGKTGVGKSTLINSIFGEELTHTAVGKPQTEKVIKISKASSPVNIYDTRGFELAEAGRKISQKEIDDLIKSLYLAGQSEEYLHVIWYCINAQSKRIESAELKLINHFSKKVPVILVLTQAYGQEAQAFQEILAEMPELKVVTIIPVVAETVKLGISDVPVTGLSQLVDETYQLLPEAVAQSFINSQKVSMQKKVETAHKIALAYIGTTFGSSFVPIPFADALTLVPIQVAMLTHLTKVFNLPIKKSVLTNLTAAILGTSLTTQLGRYVSGNLFKLIPGVGSVGGGVISGGVAAIITRVLATSYIQVLKVVSEGQAVGQKFTNREIIALTKKQYKEALKKGKK